MIGVCRGESQAKICAGEARISHTGGTLGGDVDFRPWKAVLQFLRPPAGAGSAETERRRTCCTVGEKPLRGFHHGAAEDAETRGGLNAWLEVHTPRPLTRGLRCRAPAPPSL